MTNAGIKHDTGKLPWHLLPWDAVGRAVSDGGKAAQEEVDSNCGVDVDETAVLAFASAWFQGSKPDGLAIATAIALDLLDPEAPFCETPWHALQCVVQVLDFGARKYAARNWENGLAHSRTFAATVRHLKARACGEQNDPETGLDHMAHAACELLFALAFEVRGRKDVDDRPLAPSPGTVGISP